MTPSPFHSILRHALAVIILIACAPYQAIADDAGITVEYSGEDEEIPSESESLLNIDRIFKNPALASGLSSSADAINRSLDSLMETLFYSLLDNELVYDLSEASQFTLGFDRKLHTTSGGGYVVVDRFSVGPQFGETLTTVAGVPIKLGANGRVNMLNIYLRSDGQRLAESEDLPYWRQALNNWFGLLPLLTRILPPSFNPNELYDPLVLVETPSLFPATPAEFMRMPLGSIRSYTISGGVHLAADLSLAKGLQKDGAFAGINEATASLPYTVFKTGEHRINVLRRGEYEAWIGLTDIDRVGHGLKAALGRTYLVLQKVVPFWSGMPAVFFPIDVDGTQAKATQYDQLYTFDLTKAEARSAYELAVKGDFTAAHANYLAKHLHGQQTGVEFQFERQQDSLENLITNTRNFFVQRSARRQARTEAVVETTDQVGKFHTLEAKLEIEDEGWDALVGPEQESYADHVELKVKRILKSDSTTDEPTFEFVFDQDDNEPISVTMSLKVDDRFVDAAEYKGYVGLARSFTLLPLKRVPDIPLLDDAELRKRRMATALIDPSKDSVALHVTPTYLGRMTIDAAVYFSSAELQRIFATDTDEKWRAFARAYGLPIENWATPAARDRFMHSLEWVGSVAVYPFRLFNLRFSRLDAVREVGTRIAAMKRIEDAKAPLEKLAAFDDLLATDYPVELARAMLFLSDLNQVPRSVSFSTSAKGKIAPSAQEAFGSISRKVFRSRVPFPKQQRARITRDKLAAFQPTEQREQRSRPQVAAIHIETRAVDTLRKRLNGQTEVVPVPQAYVTIRPRRVQAGQVLKAFIRLEEGGRVDVGRFVLAEQVLSLAPLSAGSSDAEPSYGFFLTGPLSPLSSAFFGGSSERTGLFDLTLAISTTGEVWSEERSVSFRFENGKLLPAK